MVTGRILGGRYEILAPIGRGGMALVFRARDTRLLREVAVKILADQQSEESAFYFHREARAIASLSHANIVPVHDYSGPNERPAFLVMHLVHGQNLEESLLGHHPLPEAVVLAAVRQIAAGLAHAHAKGVVHRDLKPANCMLEASGRVLLTDFGLAKAYDDESLLGETVAGRVTKLFGTPDFLAPEQIAREELGPYTDIFALGTLTHYLSAAQLPFLADDLLATMRRITTVDYNSLGDLRPDFSSDTLQLVEECFHPEPRARPSAERVVALCTELLSDLAGADPELVLKSFIESGGAGEAAITRVDPVSSPTTFEELASGSVSDATMPAAPAPGHTAPAPADTTGELDASWPAQRVYAQQTEATAVPAAGHSLEPPPLQPHTIHRRRSLTWLIMVGLLGASAGVALWWQHSAERGPGGAAEAAAAVSPETTRAAGAPADHETSGGPARSAEPKANHPASPQAVSEPDPAAPPQPVDASAPEPVANKQPQPSRGARASAPSPARGDSSSRRRQRERHAEPGRVRFVVVPWGAISVDGEKRGNTPLLTELTLLPGKHVVEISHPSYGKERRVLHVAPGSISTISVDFEP